MHRRLFLAAAGAALAAPPLAFGQTPPEPGPQPQRVRRRVVTTARPRVSGAPGEVAMGRWRAMPAVQVMMGDAGPFTFGVDTGFPGAVALFPEAARASGLTPTGQSVTSDPSGRNPVTIDTYLVPRLALGPLVFEGVEGSGMPAMPLPQGAPPLHGILGMALFAGHTLVMDFAGSKLALTGERLPDPDGRTVLAYPEGPFIELPLTIGERTMPCHLDTGQSRVPIIVPQEAVAGLPTQGEPRSIGVARTVSQAIPMFAVGITAPVRLGAMVIDTREVAYPTPIPMANVGGAAMEGKILTIDTDARRLRLTAPAG